MTDAGLRRLLSPDYLRQHAEQRRAAAKAAGAKRIDVTLQGDALDDYEQVKAWLDRNNRIDDRARRLQQAEDAPRRADVHDTGTPAISHGDHPDSLEPRRRYDRGREKGR